MKLTWLIEESEMENRAESRLRKRIFLGILGNLGSKIDPRDLSKKTRASGYNGHGKRDKVVRERREMSNIFGKPRILFIGRLNRLRTRGVRSYAARTRTSCMTEASTASVRMGRVAGYAGRMGRRVGRDSGSDGSELRTGRTGRIPRILATWTIRSPWSQYAGRTKVRRAYFGPIRWLPFG